MKTKHFFIRTLLVAGTIVLASTSINAQTQPQTQTYTVYPQTSVGLRVGGTTGLTLKRSTSSGADLEGIIGVSPTGLSFTGLYEITKPTSANLSGLFWYYGCGGHASIWNGRPYYYYYYYPDGRYYRGYGTYGSAFGVGIDGVLGLEYRIQEIPFSISLDVKPYIEINSAGFTYFNPDPGLGIKFRF